MKCKSCNNVIPDYSIYCLYCGTKVINEKVNKPKIKRYFSIQRAKSFIGSAAVYQIICDDKIIGTLRNGEMKAYEIDENSHRIQCCVNAPTMFYGNINNGIYGGGGAMVSDIVCIPEGVESADLYVKNGMSSLKLTLEDLYLYEED